MTFKRTFKVRTQFHQAKWDEELIFELHKPGERGVAVAPVEPGIAAEVGDGISALPPALVRRTPPALPEVAQMRVLKHYLRLSQENLGGDLNIDIGQGTCTMKYNPKINDILAADPHLARLHPLQDPATVQGALAVMHSLDLYLREISGMDRFSLQPSSGSAAILNMVSIIQAYHKDRGTAGSRDEMITTIFSHPSDAAAAAVKGYKVVTLFQGADGLPTVEDLRKAVGPRTAGLLITNPEDTGIFNPRSYALDYDLPKSIGKTRAFYGTVQVALKAYAWIRALGGRGLREVSEIAVLNNNYLLEKIRRIRGASAAHPPPMPRAAGASSRCATAGNSCTRKLESPRRTSPTEWPTMVCTCGAATTRSSCPSRSRWSPPNPIPRRSWTNTWRCWSRSPPRPTRIPSWSRPPPTGACAGASTRRRSTIPSGGPSPGGSISARPGPGGCQPTVRDSQQNHDD